MAANKDLENDENQDQQDGSGGKKKVVIIALVALLVLGGGGAAMMLLGGDETAVAEGEAGGEAVAVESTGDPIYIPLDPAFVVNFQDKNSHTKFLKAELNVVTFDEDVEEAVTKHMPAIRNNLVLLFSRQLYEDLIPNEGKETLRAEALAQVQTVIQKQMGRPGVEDLYFTSFVMQ
jgi:flagellar protein FliL